MTSSTPWEYISKEPKSCVSLYHISFFNLPLHSYINNTHSNQAYSQSESHIQPSPKAQPAPIAMVEFTVFKGSKEGRIVESKTKREIKADEVLIKVTHSGLCGTDEHYKHQDMVLGHEGAGVVEASLRRVLD